MLLYLSISLFSTYCCLTYLTLFTYLSIYSPIYPYLQIYAFNKNPISSYQLRVTKRVLHLNARSVYIICIRFLPSSHQVQGKLYISSGVQCQSQRRARPSNLKESQGRCILVDEKYCKHKQLWNNMMITERSCISKRRESL